MKTTIKELNALVITEAKKLKKNAELEEINRLSFDNLVPHKYTNCIYGQLTGDCFSSRAIELIELSCKKVFKDTGIGEDDKILNGILNGSPLKEKRMDYWSPIELFITQPRNIKNGNNKKLIDFIKGETKTLILK